MILHVEMTCGLTSETKTLCFTNSMVYFIQHKTFYVETQSIQNFVQQVEMEQPCIEKLHMLSGFHA